MNAKIQLILIKKSRISSGLPVVVHELLLEQFVQGGFPVTNYFDEINSF